jgi:autotransporter-associated beta strand protein
MNASDLGVLTLTATTATTFNVGALTGSRGIDVGVHTLAAGGNGQSTTYTGVVTGAGGLAKSGSGTLVLTATQAYTGSTGVGGGTLQLTANDQLVTTSTLAFTGANATLAIGSLSQTFGALTTGNNAALDGMAVTGSGAAALTIAGPGNVEVGPGGAVSVAGARASLNLSTLSTFTYTNAAGTVRVGLKGGATNTAAPGTSVLTLAQSNSITAAALGVADVSASSNGGDAQLLLGQANTFSIGAFNQSSGPTARSSSRTGSRTRRSSSAAPTAPARSIPGR